MRVRRLITQLNYPELVRTGVVPDIGRSTPELPSKKYPQWLYTASKTRSNIFSEMGLFVEEVIWTAVNNAPMNYCEIWRRVCNTEPPEGLQNGDRFLGAIIGTFRTVLSQYPIRHGVELQFLTVQGHPDFFAQFGDRAWILDVKTTTGFTKMAHETYLQILAYCALTRATGLKCDHVGVVLPVQKQILWWDVTGWDSGPYMRILLQEAEWVAHDEMVFNPEYLKRVIEDGAIVSPTIVGTLGRRFVSSRVGGHLAKDKLEEYSAKANGRPIQVFLANPQGGDPVASAEIERLRGVVAPGTHLFVHSAYTVKLGTFQYNEKTGQYWALERVKSELQGCQRLSGKGVVVHLETNSQYSTEQATELLEQNIRFLLQFATPECPLLLETMSGEGSELCTSIETLMELYQKLQSPNLGICVDSCHVFQARYDPAWYLEQWHSRWPGSVKLIHFNDSEQARGCRRDLHHIPGLGHIGYERMAQLYDMCIQANIPMVRE